MSNDTAVWARGVFQATGERWTMLNDTGLLIIRVAVGLIVAGHGAQKLFGWFEGPGIEGFAGMTSKIGLRPARFWAFMAGISEFGGGLLLALGLLSPLGSLGIIAAMAMAILKVHWAKGLWATKGGFELPLTNLAAALALAFTGPGAYALDTLLGIALPEPLTLWGGLALVILGLVVALLGQGRQEAPAGQTGRGRA
jgi:putative oxidoreductase